MQNKTGLHSNRVQKGTLHAKRHYGYGWTVGRAVCSNLTRKLSTQITVRTYGSGARCVRGAVLTASRVSSFPKGGYLLVHF